MVSDGAPDILGDHDFDQYVQHQLVISALNIAVRMLAKGGCFIAKVFRGKDIGLLVKQTERLFKDVYVAKPKCSRNSSIEAFLVGLDFFGTDAIALESGELDIKDVLQTLNHLENFADVYYDEK